MSPSIRFQVHSGAAAEDWRSVFYEYGCKKRTSAAGQGILRERLSRKTKVRIPCLVMLAASAYILVGLAGCTHRKAAPVSLTFLQCRFFPPDELRAARALPEAFYRQTGIRVDKLLGVPGETFEQIPFVHQLFQRPIDRPDVVEMDETWLAGFRDDFIDLKPYIPDVAEGIPPAILPNYEVDGKLIAIPYQNQVGVLAFREDLLQRYGFSRPPATWTELEKMSLRIQSGERRRGNKHFWGFVWAGAAEESLTCAALEWQVDEGGGRILEPDGTISVNNPAAIRAWTRAKHWIGWISPPSVPEYRESDALASFVAGRSAFVRIWAGEPGRSSSERNRNLRLIAWGHKPIEGSMGIVAMPAGSVKRVGVLGGLALAISRYSEHPREDASFIRFLLEKERESFLKGELPFPTPQSVEYYPDDARKANGVPSASDIERPIVISRPTGVSPQIYDQVSRSYFTAVHSVLEGEKKAPEAAQELEHELVEITHLHRKRPS